MSNWQATLNRDDLLLEAGAVMVFDKFPQPVAKGGTSGWED
jgi:hypothetical protein